MAKRDEVTPEGVEDVEALPVPAVVLLDVEAVLADAAERLSNMSVAGRDSDLIRQTFSARVQQLRDDTNLALAGAIRELAANTIAAYAERGLVKGPYLRRTAAYAVHSGKHDKP